MENRLGGFLFLFMIGFLNKNVKKKKNFIKYFIIENLYILECFVYVFLCLDIIKFYLIVDKYFMEFICVYNLLWILFFFCYYL